MAFGRAPSRGPPEHPLQGSPSSSHSSRPSRKAAPEPASMMPSEGGFAHVEHNDDERAIAEMVASVGARPRGPLGEGVEAAHRRDLGDHSIVLSSPLPAYPTGTLRVTFEVSDRKTRTHMSCG